MNLNENIRWKQRFENFTKSFDYLKKALQIDDPDFTQRAGIIQFFEMSFELAWKTMKDYLEDQGFIEVKSPREAIKKSFEIGLISEGELWLKALADRNLTTHTYDEETALELDNLIRNAYVLLLIELEETFKTK